jgi:hypothetical protein
MTVSGFTMINAWRQPFHVLERHNQNQRSAFCSRGLGQRRLNTTLLAEGQVLQSNVPNPAGQNEKANQRTKQRKHAVQREDYANATFLLAEIPGLTTIPLAIPAVTTLDDWAGGR